jgi:lipoprotein-releasing system permease protein
MTFEWMVALRYLRSPHKPAVLRLITVLSVLGVTAGVATLVVALAMNSGFRQTLQDRLLGATAHINLTSETAGGIQDYRAMMERLRSIPGVRAASPAIYQTVLLSSAGKARGVVLKGIDPALEQLSNDILTQGGARDPSSRTAQPILIPLEKLFVPDKDGIEPIFLGKILAQEIGVARGDYVTVASAQGRLTPFGMIPRTRRFHVIGVFDSGFYDTDANWGFVTLASAQQLSGVGDIAGVIEFRVTHLDAATTIARQIRSAAGDGFTTTTWMDQNRTLFRALRLEKLVTAIFVGLITFVAGLNILVVMAMTVSDKAKDIAVLMAMGARREQIRNVFLWQGISVGMVGTVLGLSIGFAAACFADSQQLIRLDPEIYAVPYVPFDSNWLDALWIAAATLGISALATFAPARAAARLHPADILRFE